jgi:type I restriction enzyme M protein
MSYDEFRKRIDTARNILVGAVPSPAGQIDQITYALMYKFMNDLDDQSAALGGKRTYFVGDYAKYNWHELMSPTLGAHERLELYRQAIQTMAKNPGLPPLFQEIYANAFLPFNSPNVLNLFLKEIDTFTHGESDDIGDAYEYLLSITGAQGDVGQFRTPRHIIKFIVEAVNPTKDDSVLDPAAGTAGFLIAAYNHVKRHHDGVDDISGMPAEKEVSLNSDELEKLHHNYHGFDIDPTMVRTASVNMYLHGFTTPDIRNHDTLSSEEYWDKRYDVILANPPFMTPKGGIQPHKKFSIAANRAEVLFVDYIASHINPVSGRAGIVVPEGIIFQSGNAYKQLRKNLVENSLYAVVSLPAGVFNPYAGVKTSVLLLDKKLAKERDDVLFVKVENDGFSLNAQRRPIAGDQFPEVLELIRKHKDSEVIESPLMHAVSRKDIAESGDYNLSGDRYKNTNLEQHSNFDFKKIDEVIEVISAKVKIKTSDVTEAGAIPVVDQSQKFIAGYTDDSNAEISDVPVVAFGDHTKAVKYVDFNFAQGADGIKILKPKNADVLHTKYLSYLMSNMKMPDKGYSRHWSDVRLIKIPLPPIEIQREIVAELDGYQKIIDAAQTIVKTYKPTIKINHQWEMAKLEDVVQIGDGNHSSSYPKASEMTASGVPFIRGVNLVDQSVSERDMKHISPEKHQQLKKGHLRTGDILFTNRGEIGKVAYVDAKFNDSNLNSQIAWLRSQDRILSMYLLNILASPLIQDRLASSKNGATLQQFTIKQIRELQIPLPPIEIQRGIVAELEAEQQLIDANKKLIDIYHAKIRTKLAEIWGE